MPALRRRGSRRASFAVLAAGIGVLGSVLATGGRTAVAQDAVGPAAELESAMTLLDELDRRRISVAYDDQPLLRIVAELESIHGVPVTADWASLGSIGVRERTNVTLRAEDTSALDVVRQLALLLGDDFDRATVESWGGRVLLTTDAIATRILAPAVYDVRDLLAIEATRVDPRGIGQTPEGGSDDAGDDDAPEDADSAGAGERLLRMALEHADAEAWMRFGGETARVTERDGVLVVSASATTHRLLRTVLAAMRQADPRGMTLEAAVVRVPAGTWDRLDRRYDPSQAAFARRLMTDADAEVLWRSRSAIAVGADLRIEEQLAGGSVVGLTLAPRISDVDRTVRLSIDLAWTPAGASRGSTLATQVPLATVGGAASLGIPGGSAAEGELVLVVLPRRF